MVNVQSVRVQLQDELIDLQSDIEFRSKCREYEWSSIEVFKRINTVSILAIFAKTYVCEQLFLRLKITKYNHRSD